METATTKIARYEILGELGRGGMGVVYRAKDPVISRIVAVKTIRLTEEGHGISHEELVERFQTEAQAAGRLTHPNIVVVYDAGEENGLYYITMELIDGKSLQSVLDGGHKLTVQRTLAIIGQVCSALQFAHDRGVVHRDIKPANIMLMRDDVVKITDFGTAKIIQYGASQKTNAVGTPSYMSPEQIKGKAVDGRADIFSLGVMLYEMTTGQKPFRGQDVASVLYKILNEEPPPPHRLDPSILPGVSSTIMKALSKSPHMRYETCGELLDDLQNYRPGDMSPRPKTAPEAGPSPAPRRAPRDPKLLKAEMPKIPGLEARPPQPAKPAPQKPSNKPPATGSAAHDSAPEEPEIVGIYQGPRPDHSGFFKRIAVWVVTILIVVMAGRFAARTLLPIFTGSAGQQQETAQSDAGSADSDRGAFDNVSGVPHASRAHPEIATVSELASPWSSKKFFYRKSSDPKEVPALIVRLPGPPTSGRSYWAFSLKAPFSECTLEYVSDLKRLDTQYDVFSRHPMVVNPCSRTIFDPLEMKEMPGNFLVRGAIVQGYDTRPPYEIEVQINGNRVMATNME